MDWEYIKHNGMTAWMVIPVFFTTYIGIILVFGGSSHITYTSHNRNPRPTDVQYTIQWPILFAGVCILSMAIVYAIIVCLIVPVRRKRKRHRQQIHVTEQDTVSVEGVMHNWFASDTQDTTGIVDSSHTQQYR